MPQEFSIDNKTIAKIKPRLGGVQTLRASMPMTQQEADFNTRIWLIKAGSGKLIVPDGMLDFGGGDLIVCNPGARCGVFFDTPGEIKIVTLTFNGFPDAGRLCEGEFVVFQSNAEFERLAAVIALLEHESGRKRPIGKYAGDNLLKVFIAYALRAAQPPDETDYKNRAFIKARDYFDAHFLQITNIDTACRLLSVNKFYLTHLFKENLGVPPIKYLIEKRVGHAKKLLAETDKSIGEVAYVCGYEDAAYFCRIFKKTTGSTPLKYRRVAHQ